MMSPDALSRQTSGNSAKRREATVIKSFRLPRQLTEVLAADAEERNTSVTELLVSILSRYVGFDKNAEKYGFITVSKTSYRALIDALSEEQIREIAASQSVGFGEFVEFWFKKKDLNSVLDAVGVMSKYLRSFEYTTSRDDREVTITLRTDLGRKFALFIATAWEKGIARTLGISPKVEIAENQAIIKLAIRDDSRS
jgi:hypothetical protein